MLNKVFLSKKLVKTLYVFSLMLLVVSAAVVGVFFITNQAQAQEVPDSYYENFWVVSPNGGETLSGTETITWRYSHGYFGQTYDIYYQKDSCATNTQDWVNIDTLSTSSSPIITFNGWDTTFLENGQYCIWVEKTSGDVYKEDVSDGLFTVDNEVPVEGCMDESAYNYDEYATIDDESCVYDVCSNLDGLQESVPEGYEMGEGECTLLTGTIRVCKYEDKDGDGEPEYEEYEASQDVSFLPRLWNAIRIKEVLAQVVPNILHPLSSWTIKVDNGDGVSETGQTADEESEDHGCVTFTVPYGTYTVSENVVDHWEQTGMGSQDNNNQYTQNEDNMTVTINDDAQEANVYFLNYHTPYSGSAGGSSPVCGDGTLAQAYEECDDGNTVNGDGCSSACLIESGETGGGSETPVTIFDEHAGEIGGDYALIAWQTDRPATSRVIYDTVSHPDISGETAPNYGYAYSTPEDSSLTSSHAMVVTGLTPNTVYYFRPVSHASPEAYGTEIETTTNEEEAGVVVLGAVGTPDLQLSKTADKAVVNIGDSVEFTIVITNNGSIAADDATLIDSLPVGMEYVDGATGIWEFDSIAPGEFVTVNYTVNVTDEAEGEMINTAQVSAANHAGASASAAVTLENIVVLSESGFDIREFILLAVLLASLSGLSIFLKRKALN